MQGDRFFLNLAAILFGAIIIFGEAFKLNLGLVKISLLLLLIIFTVLIALNGRLRFFTTPLDKALYFYAATFLVFTVVGFIRGNHISDIFEDLYPVVSFISLYIIWRSFNADQINWLWKKIILFAIVAAIKVILIAIFPFEVLWDNNWQATKEPLPLDLFYRIILRGGDIFLSFALVYFIIDVQRRNTSTLMRNLILIFLLVFAVFISLSRSSYLGIIVALAVTLILFRKYFSARKLTIFFFSIVTILLLLLPFFNTISLASSIFEARVEAFDANDVAVDFRRDEKSIALSKAATSYYMGNGLGSYFYIDLSGSDKKDDRSIYIHDFNVWFILKTGVLGLAFFYLIFFYSSFNLFQCLRLGKDKVCANVHLMILSLFASGIVLLAISFLANKINTISGSIFLAFYAASSAILRKTYESSL